MRKKFQQESENAALVDWPEAADIQDIDAKISSSLLHSGHHDTGHILAACRKIAQLPWVTAIIGGHFENTAFARIKHVSDDGLIRMLWASDQRAANLSIATTARGQAQTLKVANRIKQILDIR